MGSKKEGVSDDGRGGLNLGLGLKGPFELQAGDIVRPQYRLADVEARVVQIVAEAPPVSNSRTGQALGQDLTGDSGSCSQGHTRHPRLLQKVSSVYPCRRIGFFHAAVTSSFVTH